MTVPNPASLVIMKNVNVILKILTREALAGLGERQARVKVGSDSLSCRADWIQRRPLSLDPSTGHQTGLEIGVQWPSNLT